MFRPLTLVLFLCAYVTLLFVIALWGERGSPLARRLTRSPAVYGLALAVYCTSWTFYGSVGSAATSGPLFLTIYLGPTLAIILWPLLLRKLVRIKNAHSVTSIADLISARYGKSHLLAAIATVLALIGTMPYIALQLKAVTSSFTQLTANGGASSWVGDNVGVVTVVLMTVFSVVIGARRLDATERHEGLLLALAVECVVKLAAFLMAGIFVTYFMFDGFEDLFRRIEASQFRHLMDAGRGDPASIYQFLSFLILAMSAIQFLPRQFHIAVVENSSERNINTAIWILPAYLLLINIFVVPIAAAGLLAGLPVSQTDSYVLGLPVRAGHGLVSLFVFLGGVSAATGMIIVESLAVATMITNHLLLPLIEMTGLGFLRRFLLRIRWAAVAAVLATGYLFEQAIGGSYTLVNMGIISFAAVLQFAPPILGGLFWERGNRQGAIWGLTTGAVVWFYTLLLPSFVKSGWLPTALLDEGPFGIGFLRPERLFGLQGLPVIPHAVFWSMFFNVGLYVVVSLLTERSETERQLADSFVHILSEGPARRRIREGSKTVALASKRPPIERMLGQYFEHDDAAVILERCERTTGVSGQERITVAALAGLYAEIERVLAGSIGTAAAHRAVRHSLSYTPEESEQLTQVYGEILAGLKVSPGELQSRVDFYQERTRLLQAHATELEQKYAELNQAQEELRRAHDSLETRVQDRTRELKASNEQLTAEVQERQRAQQDLARSNAELEQFAYVASHDLQEPLRMVASYVQLLERRYRGRLDKDADEFIGFAVDGAKRMQSLINDLLAYARIGTRGKPFVPVESERVAREAVANLAVAIRESQAQISYGALPVLRADATQLAQLFQNLIGNAIKFHGERPPEVKIAAERRDQDHAWLFSVADNGIGIDPQYHEHVFRLFQRLHTRTAYPGTGIGLALCKKIVERHGGHIWVNSQVGQGSTFYFTIPDREEGSDERPSEGKSDRDTAGGGQPG
jgi:Na+/proline symporter/signal transduction histidine kinase